MCNPDEKKEKSGGYAVPKDANNEVVKAADALRKELGVGTANLLISRQDLITMFASNWANVARKAHDLHNAILKSAEEEI